MVATRVGPIQGISHASAEGKGGLVRKKVEVDVPGHFERTKNGLTTSVGWWCWLKLQNSSAFLREEKSMSLSAEKPQ